MSIPTKATDWKSEPFANPSEDMKRRIAAAKTRYPSALDIYAVVCPDCRGRKERCLAGCSAHPSNWYECETCKGDGAVMVITYQSEAPFVAPIVPETPPDPGPRFRVGDKVKKVTGEYFIKGEVRAVFTKADGAVRLVVEHNAEGGGSFLHIYSEANLELQS